MQIENKDISVIIQGPINGKPHDNIKNRHTYHCLESIRKILPGAVIILSTWDGENTDDLNYDVVVKSDDPGYFLLRNETRDGVRHESANRQIISTNAGIKLVKTKYCIKMRSDLVLKNSNFITYFEKYANLPNNEKYKITKSRVVFLTTINPRRKFKNPFSMSDWFYFGETEDIANIFNIPLMSNVILKGDVVDGLYSIENNYSTEQHLWYAFISKYKDITFNNFIDASESNICLSEAYIANNSILLTAKRGGIKSLKYPGASYAQIPCLSYSGLYTWNEYKRLLNKYTPTRITIFPNPFESIVYYGVYNLRFWLKNISPSLHDFIARTVNPKNHKRK